MQGFCRHSSGHFYHIPQVCDPRSKEITPFNKYISLGKIISCDSYIKLQYKDKVIYQNNFCFVFLYIVFLFSADTEFPR
jgi:hypothetical protein